jgi:hypothetical protein
LNGFGSEWGLDVRCGRGRKLSLFRVRLSGLLLPGKDFSCIAAKFGPEFLREREFFSGCESFDE